MPYIIFLLIMLKNQCLTFFDKEKYVFHYENLQLYLRLGLKSKKKIHRVLEFNQSQWLKLYFEFNSQKKNRSRKNNDKGGKTLYKLIKNAIYGKTMEYLRNRINVKLVNNEKNYLKCTSKPSYMLHKIFDNNLVKIRKSNFALKLNKPAYIEMLILELNNILMYEFHYDYLNNKYDNKSKLLFTDADSLMYEIKT